MLYIFPRNTKILIILPWLFKMGAVKSLLNRFEELTPVNWSQRLPILSLPVKDGNLLV